MIQGHGLNDLIGREARDERGELVGLIRRIYIDPAGPSPTWVVIGVETSEGGESFAPLTEAVLEGRIVHLPYARDFVVTAPRIHEDGVLDRDQEDSLCSYYRVGGAAA